jgi:hypothetical protein
MVNMLLTVIRLTRARPIADCNKTCVPRAFASHHASQRLPESVANAPSTGTHEENTLRVHFTLMQNHHTKAACMETVTASA